MESEAETVVTGVVVEVGVEVEEGTADGAEEVLLPFSFRFGAGIATN